MRAVTYIVVAATVALAILPIAADQFSKEIARWHVAAAANAIVLDEGDADYHLEKVRQWSDDPQIMHDYGRFRLMHALQSAPSQAAAEIFKAAISETPSLRSAGLSISVQLLNEGEFQDALDVLDLCWTDELDAFAGLLNQRAYLRALAVRDLDQALHDIDRALGLLEKQQAPSRERSALLDTRAWILFQMGRPLEALSDINQSIKLLEHAESSDWMENALGWLEPATPTATDDAPQAADQDSDNEFLSRESDPSLWNRGVLYYHRAKILEALGRTDEATRDFDWLRRRRLPVDHRLF